MRKTRNLEGSETVVSPGAVSILREAICALDPLVVQPVAEPSARRATASEAVPVLEGASAASSESRAALAPVAVAPAAVVVAERKLQRPPQARAGAGPEMRVNLCGVELASPVIAASGTFGYGVEFEEIVSLNRIGAFVTKGLSREPMLGNAAPRVIETASGMMNAIGLQNMGVRAFIEQKMPRLRKIPGAVVIANVFGFTVRDCCAVVEALNDAPGIALYELNASCPNTKHGGMVFGTDAHSLDELVRAVTRCSARPVMVKLSPNVTSIARMARVAEEAGADAVSLVNTFLALAIDVETRRPRIANVTGGLSGPAIKPIAVRMVYEVAHAVSVPVVGMGGILRAEDAVEFLLAGATAVQVGTANYADPRAVENIASGLRRWCAGHEVKRVSELTRGLVV